MDRRITKTKEAIQNAFFQLIEENQTTKITITKIAKTANIDRKNVFSAIYELLEKDLSLYQNFASHSVYDSFWEKFKEICVQNATEAYAKKLDISPLSLDIYVNYVFSGVISVYRRYLQKDNPYNLEEVSQILNDVTFYGLTPILEKK